MTLRISTVAAVRSTMPYDPRADLHGVAVFGRTASVLVVHDELPVKSVPELIAYAKANPGKLLAASSGNATGSISRSKVSSSARTSMSCTSPIAVWRRRSRT